MYIIKCYSGEILYKIEAIKIKFLFVIKLIFIHCYFLFDHFIMFLLLLIFFPIYFILCVCVSIFISLLSGVFSKTKLWKY